jgi:hypothetical protein
MTQDSPFAAFLPPAPVSGPTTDPSNVPAFQAPEAPVTVDPATLTPPAPEAPVTVDPATLTPPAPVVPVLAVGDLVAYRHRDVTTGTDLTGAGVVVRVAGTGSVRVAPLSYYTIDALPELVAPLAVDLLDVLA